MSNDNYYMEIALKEAKKSIGSGDIPIGAVVVLNGEILSKAHNTKEKDGLVTSHAEITAINQASKKLGNYRMDGGTIYITKEPCLMCMGAIIGARIKNVYFGCYDKKFKVVDKLDNFTFNHHVNIQGSILEEECARLLSDFFKKLR